MARTLKLIKGEALNSKAVFIEVLSMPPQGCNLYEMRKRIKVIDQIEAAQGDEVVLEDADYELLKRVFEGNQFRIVHRDLLAIYDTLT